LTPLAIPGQFIEQFMRSDRIVCVEQQDWCTAWLVGLYQTTPALLVCCGWSALEHHQFEASLEASLEPEGL